MSLFVTLLIIEKTRIEDTKLKRIIMILDARTLSPKSMNARLIKYGLSGV
jgi:hypothetical protein